MTDIFLSYASADRERIRPLVSVLEQQGWSVWWDRKIPPGKTYDQVIEQALEGARCIVVVWSQTSVQSEWVKVEADEGMNRNALVPVLIEEAKIPLAFRRIQAARLIDWKVDSSHPELTMLFESIKAITGEAEPKEESIREEGRVQSAISEAPFQRSPDQYPPQPAINELQIPAFLRLPPPVGWLKHKGPKRNLKPWLAIGGAVTLFGLAIAAIWAAGIGKSNFEFDVVTMDEGGKVAKREKKSATHFTEEINGVRLEMVEIPGGKFIMGSPEEVGVLGYESPQHEVTIRTFLMSKYEITQEQWRAVSLMQKEGDTDLIPIPSEFKGDDLPVEKVSWPEAQEFCRRLSAATKRVYRLPSEAEWEYAARAGSSAPFSFGPTITPDIVNYDGDYPYGSAPKGERRGKTTKVGSLGVANAFGLFDMHGNVEEWCEDHFSDNYIPTPVDGTAWIDVSDKSRLRVSRGGGWSSYARNCRSASRSSRMPSSHYNDLGFRLVRASR